MKHGPIKSYTYFGDADRYRDVKGKCNTEMLLN